VKASITSTLPAHPAFVYDQRQISETIRSTGTPANALASTVECVKCALGIGLETSFHGTDIRGLYARAAMSSRTLVPARHWGYAKDAGQGVYRHRYGNYAHRGYYDKLAAPDGFEHETLHHGLARRECFKVFDKCHVTRQRLFRTNRRPLCRLCLVVSFGCCLQSYHIRKIGTAHLLS